jgi:hypothetical protein
MESEKQTAQQLLDQLNAIRKMSGMQQQLPQQQQK